jgi:hypothetical protein
VVGYVGDAYGPVEGIAVQIGNETVYSNADGRFETRFKKAHIVSVGVLLAESTAPGLRTVVSSAGTAIPGGEPVKIQVRRIK